jgi:NAD(P)-dependent dehydrogenase (short-subunit alcohol dehydrogenase family)
MEADTDWSPIDTFRVDGRVALVTGARRGIGRAIAIALAVQGANVAVHHVDNDEERRDAEAVVAEIVAHGGRATGFAADFADSGSARDVAARVAAALGPIDILVLNASIELLEDYTTISPERFDRQIAINLRAPLELLQAALPGMKARGWGRVLAIGSIQQRKPSNRMLVYAGTKSAQNNWVRNLARQVGPTGVTINNLAPGAIWTARNNEFMSDDAFRGAFEQRIPLGRLGNPADLVGAALLLCSDAGRYINGADLFVDGGLAVS